VVSAFADGTNRQKTQGAYTFPDHSRFFLAGGTGFVGRWLVHSFLVQNEQLGGSNTMAILTRNPEKFIAEAPDLALNRSITLVQGDVRTFEYPTGQFQYIIHGATESSAALNAENPKLMYDTIVQGTARMLDFSARAGAQRFLFISSGAVYGTQPPAIRLMPEDYANMPQPHGLDSAYAKGKLTAEHLCAKHGNRHPDTVVTIARCFAFVGPHLPLDRHFAIGNFIRDGLRGGPIVVRGDGTPLRSYLYAADLASWLWTILFRGRSLRPYNVGSEEEVSIADLAALVASHFVPPPAVHILERARPDAPPERYVPSTKRATSELGLNKTVGLTDAIRRTIDWHRQCKVPHKHNETD